MASFSWSLPPTRELVVRRYTEKDYCEAKAKQKPDLRKPAVTVLLSLRCDSAKHSTFHYDLASEISRHGSHSGGNVSEAANPQKLQSTFNDSLSLTAPVSLPEAATNVIRIISQRLEDSAQGCSDFCDRQQESNDHLNSSAMELETRHSQVHKADVAAQAEPTGVVKSGPKAITDQPGSRRWTAEEDASLLRLKHESQLPWKDIESYFPERSQACLPQRYLRLKSLAKINKVTDKSGSSKTLGGRCAPPRARASSVGSGCRPNPSPRSTRRSSSNKTRLLRSKHQASSTRYEHRPRSATKKSGIARRHHEDAVSDRASSLHKNLPVVDELQLTRFGRTRRPTVRDPRDGYA